MEDNGRKTWYDGSMKKGKDPRGGLRRVFCYSLDFCVFTCCGCQPTASGGHIFRCTTKDMEERRASSSQAPHPSFCLSGQKLSRSAAPPLPTKPTSLGFGGAPIGGPLESPGVNSDRKPDVLCAYVFAMVRVTRLSRAWRAPHCFHALCVLRCHGR